MNSEDTIVHQDCSTLSHYLKRWWNFATWLTPSFISPNMITFTGGFFMIASALLSLYSQESWTLPFHALAIFLFQTLDAMDGIQARKLGASSKLGNFIDHYTDVFSLQIMFYVMLRTLKIGEPLNTITMLFANYNIFIAHWETVRTNVLYFTDGFSITEFQIIAILVHLFGYLFPNFWETVPLLSVSFGSAFILGLMVLNTVFVVVPLIQRVVAKRGRDVLWSLLPLTWLTFVSWFWMRNLPVTGVVRTAMMNLPFLYVTGDLLIDFLYKNSPPLILFLTPYVYQLAVLFFDAYEFLTLVLFLLVIYQYWSTIYRMACEFDIPILLVKRNNLNKNE